MFGGERSRENNYNVHTKTENKMVNIIHNKCISSDETNPLLDVLFTSKLVYQHNNIKHLVYYSYTAKKVYNTACVCTTGLKGEQDKP